MEYIYKYKKILSFYKKIDNKKIDNKKIDNKKILSFF